MPPVLEVAGIAKSYGERPAVRSVSLSVASGEVLGLIGPNGAGKTTTLRVVLGIIPADAGEVRVFGEPLRRAARDRIGYIPEERGLYQKARVMETLVYAGRLKGLGRREAAARAREALERVGLPEHARSRVRELSKGMQQKIQLAGALVHRPDLLVLDEPLSGLDPLNRRFAKDLIREEARRGAAVILSSHEMDVVERLCDRAVFVHAGEVVLEGPIRALRERFARADVLLSLRAGSIDACPAAAAMVAARVPGNGGVAGGAPGLEHVTLHEGATPEAFLSSLIAEGAAIDHFERALPTLEDIFVSVVGRKSGAPVARERSERAG